MNKPYIARSQVSFDKLPEQEDTNEIYIYYTEDPQSVDIQDRTYKYLAAAMLFDTKKLSEVMTLLPIEATAYCYIQGGHDEVVFKTRRSPVTIQGGFVPVMQPMSHYL